MRADGCVQHPETEILRTTSGSLTLALHTNEGETLIVASSIEDHKMAKKGTFGAVKNAQLSTNHCNSEVKNRRGAPDVDGHDRLLHDLPPPSYPPPAQHAQVRSSR